MEHLIGYMEAHRGELVEDLLPALREADSVFRSCDVEVLSGALSAAVDAFSRYLRGRDVTQLEQSLTALRALRPEAPFLVSTIVRVFSGFQDLVAVRTESQTVIDQEAFADAIRALRAGTREAICYLADRAQSRHVDVRATGALGSDGEAQMSRRAELVARLRPVGASGRIEPLRQMWARLRQASGGAGPQVIGVRSAPAMGRRALVAAFMERVGRHLGQAPMTLQARAPQLFELPNWPITSWVRACFDVPLGTRDASDRVLEALDALQGRVALKRPELAEALEGAGAALLGLIGEDVVGAGATPARTAGIQLRRALVALLEALAHEAQLIGGPLVLVIEDAEELDAPSWHMLTHLMARLDPSTWLILVLTYGEHFELPVALTRGERFGEIPLDALDMNECEALIDTLLSPNHLNEQTRLRLNVAAQGSPMRMYEAVRQLVLDGALGLSKEHWAEIAPLPDRVLVDLNTMVERRSEALSSAARLVIEIVAVIEDCVGGLVIEEMAARHALGGAELLGAISELVRAGIVTADISEGDMIVQFQHPMMRDEIYRSMGLDRRRALHEDAAEVFMRLAGARGFPSLVAGHLMLAAQPTRALWSLISGIDRCLRSNGLEGAHGLCERAVGLMQGIGPGDQIAFGVELLRRRERINEMLGRRGAQIEDLVNLDASVNEPAEMAGFCRRRAGAEVATGQYSVAEDRLISALSTANSGSIEWMRAQLGLAINCWQHGEAGDARAFLDEALDAVNDDVPWGLRARLLHLRGRLSGERGRLTDARHHFFEAWRAYRRANDLYGAALSLQGLAQTFWGQGQLAEAITLLERADLTLRDCANPVARATALIELAELQVYIGRIDEAEARFITVRGLTAHEPALRARACIGLGRIYEYRGDFSEAMPALARSLEDHAEGGGLNTAYVDILLAVARTVAQGFAGDELSALGGLRYATEALQRAETMGLHAQVVEALTLKLRGLTMLGRCKEAVALVPEVLMGLDRVPQHQRIRTGVHMACYRAHQAVFDDTAAAVSLEQAAVELQAQAGCLTDTPYLDGFLALPLHQELIADAGLQPRFVG